MPVGNAAGNQVTSWLSPAPVLVGALAVAFSGYLAAVYLAADSVRYGEPDSLAADFRRRALLAGVVSGGLALAGLLVMRGSGLNLTSGAALALVCVSAVAGLATLALCWASRFGLARLTAALAVAAVVVGWAAAQAPRFLPGMTVTQAAAGRLHAGRARRRGGLRCRGAGPVARPAVHAVPAGTTGHAGVARARGSSRRAAGPAAPTAPGATGATDTPAHPAAAPGRARSAGTGGTRDTRGGKRGAMGRWGTAAVAGLVAGTGLLVFTDAPWTHVLGVAGLLLCAVAVFALTAAPLDR